MRSTKFAAAILVAVSAATASGQIPDSTHKPTLRIIGIFDSRSGTPLAAVQVSDAFTGSYVVTTATGTARLDFLTFRGAAAFVELRKLGYQAKQIIVSRDDTTSTTELLDPVTELAPVISTETYRIDRDAGVWGGFEARCQVKAVTCFRNEELENKPTSSLADFLIHADGMTIGACGGGSGTGSKGAGRTGQCGKIAMRSTVIPPPYCQPTFFVDGFQWNSAIAPPTDLVPNKPAEAPYTPGNVKGVEVYPPGHARPLRFEGSPTCGVVVIWTK